MTDRAATSAALGDCYDDLEALVTDLGADEWAVPSLCPGWRVRDVVVHLAGIEQALIGWAPARDDEPPPFHLVPAFADAAATWSDDALAARTVETLARRRAELAALPDAVWVHPCATPAGPGTYGRFMELRIFDLWIHQRDMALPLGRPTVDRGPAAEITVDEVHGALGYIVGKRIGLPDGMRIAFHLSGGVTRDMFVEVDGRARVVESLEHADVEVHADATTFLLLAAGRVDPAVEIDAERIGWTGDPHWGERAATNLRYTI